MFTIQFRGRAVRVCSCHQFMPPVIAAGLHVDRRASAADDYAGLHRRRFFQGLIDRGFEFHFFAASPAAISRDYQLCNSRR